MIKSEQEYQDKIKRIEEIFNAQPGSLEYKELADLCHEVHDYKEEHYPMPPVSQNDIEDFLNEQNNL